MAAPQATDLFVVHRPTGGTNHKVPYSDLKTDVSYTLPAATAGGVGTGTLGGVKVDGSTITIDANNVIKANLPGALVYKGPLDVAADPNAAPPAGPAQGDVYIASTGGTLNNAGWGTENGSTVSIGDLFIFDGSKWDVITTGGGTGIQSISATAGSGVSVSNGNSATPVIAGIDATDSVKGVVQLADAAAITAGTSTSLVTTVAQLTAVDSKITYAAQGDFTNFPTTVTGKIMNPAVTDTIFLRKDFSKLPDA